MSFPRADSKVDPAHGLGPVLESTAIEDHGSPTWLSVRPGRAFGLALRDWAWELAGTVAAGLMLVAIGISMYKYDKTKQSDWAINLTTLVAIISTFLRATLVFIVTSILSQLAWNWFDQPHPLDHLDSLHAVAGGGLRGALRLITARMAYAPVIICLAVSTATFGIGPFTQQSIRSMPCDDVVLSVGEIPLSNFVTAPNYDDPPDPSLPVHYGSVKRLFDYDMTYMIRQGFTLNTANVPTVGTHARCTTGNCTFPEYSSLAICSRCFDVSSDIRTKTHVDRTAVYLPNGCTVRGYLSNQPYGKEYNDVRIVWLQARWLQMLYDGEGRDRNIDQWPFSVADDDFKRIARSMLPITLLGLGGDGKVEDASAAVCALYPCIQTYSGAFKDDKFDEVVTSEVPLELDYWGAAYAVLSPCNIDGHAYSFENNFTVPGHQPGPARTASLNVTGKPWSVPVECLYYATKDFMLSWSDYIATTFRTNCTMILHEAKSHVCDTFGFEALVNNGNASFDVYSKVMDNIAKATTTQLRISDINAAPVDFYYPDAFNGSIIRNVSLVQRGSVGGVGSRTTVCYEMQWQWLAFPAGMVVAVLLLVLWAIQSTFARRLAGRPVWKSSVLPLLFHGLLPSGSSGNGGSAGWGAGPGQRSARELETTALQEKASRVVVQLVNGKEGCGFMVVNGPDRRAAEEDAQQEWQDEPDDLDRASIDTDRWVTGIQGLRARPDGRS